MRASPYAAHQTRDARMESFTQEGFVLGHDPAEPKKAALILL